MGYSTSFEGKFTFDKPLTSAHMAYLAEFARTRHDERTHPSFYCQWVPTEDGTALEWDGNEKFREYTEWLEYLIYHLIAPWEYTLNGSVRWEGEKQPDTGTITINNNHVEATEDTIVSPTDVSLASDFADLDVLLKSGSVNKERVWVNVDEDIVRVFHGDDIIFSAAPENFVNAFFTLYGINIDENLENREV